MPTPKRKLFAGANSEDEFTASKASLPAKKASSKKAAIEDSEINKPSSARRMPDTQKLEDTEWIRENYNVKTLLHLLDECSEILIKYNPVITGSAAVLIYLVASYQDGRLSRQEFDSMLKTLKPVNDIDAVFDSMVRIADFANSGFKPILRHATKLPDILMEADGIPFVKDTMTLDPKTGKMAKKTVKLEIIIAKTLGRKREPEIVDRQIKLPERTLNLRILHPRELIREYRNMDEDGGERDDSSKIAILEQLIHMNVVTPVKQQKVSRIARANTTEGRKTLAF